MGFLEAVKSLGRMEAEALKGEKSGEEDALFADIADYLEQPLDPKGNPPEKVIRVWCRAVNIDECLEDESLPLHIEGVHKIDCVDYGAGGDAPDPEKIKRELLYRNPAGKHITWSYSPVYKLGKEKDSQASLAAKLVGKGNNWSSDKNSRLFKLNKRVIRAFSEAGTWTPDSAALVMEALAGDFLNHLAELWTSAKASTVLVFGIVSSSGEFLWPGEIPQYRRYFKEKLSGKKPKAKKKIHATSQTCHCALCSAEIHDGEPFKLSRAFRFATFDKVGFLPGIRTGKDGKTAIRKVWPICSECGGLISRGRSYIDQHYLKDDIIWGTCLFVVPELTVSGGLLSKADDLSKDFLKQGIKTEERLFNYLAKQGDALVFHLVFWEKNNAQELIHLMIEDVPPTRLKRLEAKWKEAADLFPFPSAKQDLDERATLDYALRSIYGFFLYGARSDDEKRWLRGRALGVWGRLLEGSRVDVSQVKSLAVSRLPACFSDEKWVQYMGPNMIQSARIIDFLTRTNER